MYRRNIAPLLREALRDTPVVLLNGARQTGKSTLIGSRMLGDHEARFLTLDEAGVLAAAEADPSGFLSGLEGPVILDEVQRSPGLFPGIKAEVRTAPARPRTSTSSYCAAGTPRSSAEVRSRAAGLGSAPT